MRLKRKLVKREIVYNIVTDEIDIIDYYKDVLDESLHRKMLKDISIWANFIVVTFNILSIILNDNKFIHVLSTLLIIFFSYLIYRRIKDLKQS